METKEPLPNAVAVLVLGICSIVFGLFFVGLILGIIGIAVSSKGRKMYNKNPDSYKDYGTLNAGYIMSIIGLVLSGIYIVFCIICVAIFGGVAFSLWHLSN